MKENFLKSLSRLYARKAGVPTEILILFSKLVLQILNVAKRSFDNSVIRMRPYYKSRFLLALESDIGS
jgi:hypothetical protein